MSTSAQPQFRYTQTPSKVLHLRNLPWECTDEELVEVCKPFGKIVNTKCNVGANRNQAFVEFVDLNQAINMVTYYASSPEPAHIRGKTVYVQYSNRHEIVNNKSPGDVPGNVLLVTIEGVEAGDVSIDVIHLVFSAFGFVHKIATFEKAAGFQALIQYSDVETASTARDSLDGRSIPRHVFFRIIYRIHVPMPLTSISFPLASSCRDYTNPYLPVNPTAMGGFLQPGVGPDGNTKEFESNVLLASIENMQYAVTVDVLHTVMIVLTVYFKIYMSGEFCIKAISSVFDQVFSTFGTVQKIAIFEKNGGTHALIQYPDIATAGAAKEALEGHCIYDGGYCKLHISYSRHTDLNVKAYSDKSRDYTIPVPPPVQQAPGVPTPAAGWQNSSGTFPGQVYASNPHPAYATSTFPPGSSPPAPASHIAPGVLQTGSTQPLYQPNVFPGGASHPNQPAYYRL
ncbi:hypothetical protein BUALT_Bualt16G0007000 [Buddleja alternifolia]|uniref:RRM domain-containing protein n=1 Tax=Buddleja alternifolia TaxID=168488 RepID=A0AAV6WDE2_9LAMI|nr:hypothetical protein BUALT_Bualt16G0007000 [Buddleja alternifolia]